MQVQALRPKQPQRSLVGVEQGVKCVATKVGIVVQAMVGGGLSVFSNPTQTIVERNL